MEEGWLSNHAHPIAMFLVGPVFLFLIVERIPPARGKREIASVWWTNLALLLIVNAMVLTFGWKAYLTVQLLVTFFSTSVGVWLFYVQHNFEGVYWERHPQWDYFKASMQGSSFYRLPALLQWFTGNIGFHHIHHLGSKIPNYNLARAYRESTLFHVQPGLGRESPGGRLQWRKSAFGDYRFVEGTWESRNMRIWRIRELLSSQELISEGRRMHHCVASYAASCHGGKCSIWSMDVDTDEGIEPLLTIEVGHDTNEIPQVRGIRNRLSTEKEKEVIRRWALQEKLGTAAFR